MEEISKETDSVKKPAGRKATIKPVDAVMLGAVAGEETADKIITALRAEYKNKEFSRMFDKASQRWKVHVKTDALWRVSKTYDAEIEKMKRFVQTIFCNLPTIKINNSNGTGKKD